MPAYPVRRGSGTLVKWPERVRTRQAAWASRLRLLHQVFSQRMACRHDAMRRACGSAVHELIYALLGRRS